MKRIFSLVLVIVSLLFLASVTIFDPAKVNEKLILKLIPPPPRHPVPERIVEDVEEIQAVVSETSESGIRDLVEEICSFPKDGRLRGRVTGYEGNIQAGEFVEQHFRECLSGVPGARVWREALPVTVPIDEKAKAVVLATSEEIPLYCLWPNQVRTPSLPQEGIRGNLIYGGRGEWLEFNGKKVDGSICLMDFDCGENFVHARMLGAKAVIFFDNGKVTRGEAYDKFLAVPVDFPRYWVEKEYVPSLMALAQSEKDTLLLQARMRWKTVETYNIFGFLPGDPTRIEEGSEERWSDRLIVIESFYDSMSVVPGLAAGAEQAGGLAALLEVMQAFSKFRPKYTILFMASSGHFEGLEGINHFLFSHARTSDFFREKIPPLRRMDFDLFIGLDLTSGTEQVACLAQGIFYTPDWQTDTYLRNTLAHFAKRFAIYTKEIFPDDIEGEKSRYRNAVSPMGRSWKDYMATELGFDSEAVNFVGYKGVTLVTPHDLRERTDTPVDRPEFLNIGNLTKSVQTVVGLLLAASRDEGLFIKTKLSLEDKGHQLRGNVVEFDRSVNFFVPKAALEDAVVCYRRGQFKTLAGVRTLLVNQSCSTNPSGGDETRGFKAESLTADARRVLVSAWAKDLDEITEGKVRLALGEAVYEEELEKGDDGVWQAVLLTVRPRRSLRSILARIGLLLLAAMGLGLITAIRKDMSERAKKVFKGLAYAVLCLPLLWTFYVLFLERKPDGWIPEGEVYTTEPVIKELVLAGPGGEYRVRDIDISFGSFKGQFRFDIMRNDKENTILAYKFNPAGKINFAPDLGGEGDKTYPIKVPWGWWQNEMLEVLFPCRGLSIFEIIDPRYLTALDTMSVLGVDNSDPQWYGLDYVKDQSLIEGKTTKAAVAFLKPGQRAKIFMSTSILGIRYLLTNAPREYFEHPLEPEEIDETVKMKALGVGYLVDEGLVSRPSYKAAIDMWVLDDVRMKELARFAVQNQKINLLHQEAYQALKRAEEHLKQRQYDKFIAASREGLGLESRAYPDVKGTANDTVKGIVFYFILLLPFSLFCERLLFGFRDIRSRMAGFAGIFFAVFLILHRIHPAFRLSTSPYVIFLAFVIFAMGAVVSIIIMGKFGKEVERMKRATSGVFEADVGRLSATFAAIGLGINNLRKRKVRTTLTAVTLILLTFTVLSFTSVVTSIKFFTMARENRPAYEGMLVRDRNWRGLQDSVHSYLQSAFQDKATVIPRNWFMGRLYGDRLQVKIDSLDKPGVRDAYALFGMVPEERILWAPEGGLPEFMVDAPGSRWFEPGDEKVCIMPYDPKAQSAEEDNEEYLKIEPEDVGKVKVRMLGSEFLVIGLFDINKMDAIIDLDNEKITPVDTVQESAKIDQAKKENPNLTAAEPIEPFKHLLANTVVLVPFEFLKEAGGRVGTVAVANFKTEDFIPLVEDFMSRVSLTVFVGQGDRETGKVVVYSSIGAITLSGLKGLLVPVLIAGFIVLNTMMGAVHERYREIGIYSSVGLAPKHIAALFLAEAAVFATIGAVAGYLLGQVLTITLAHFEWLKGMFLNYSSLSAISSTLIVMATVFLSTLYPAKMAANVSVPDVTRRWKFPEPEGDDWKFDFPFTMAGAEVLGMYAYLTKVFESYGEASVGEFVAENVDFSADLAGASPEYIINMKTWLAPYDLGISQTVTLDAIPTEDVGIYKVEVTLHRLSGEVASWRRINRGFLQILRKRFLVWRTVPRERKKSYEEEGQTILGIVSTEAK
ncbi:MAG: hypothetical protein AMS15_02960 [Planctomycetes bacterium DG_23]|nr:MAG: hypothetical protein AMS15_02960 [Planctomycetes bacterium DG_23]